MKRTLMLMLPFAAAMVILLALMPHGAKFQVHIHKGAVWNRPSMSADFDFPLYKSDSQIKMEQTNITESLLPYYQHDSSIMRQQSKLIEKELFTHKNTPHAILPIIMPAIEYIYSKGIRSHSSIVQSYTDSMSAIYIISNNHAKIIPIAETFTQQQAQQYIEHALKNNPSLNEAQQQALLHADWEKYLQPNLHFDKALSDAAKQERLSMLSPTCGMVLKGERIIAKGDIINEERLQKIASYHRELALMQGFTGSVWQRLAGQALLIALLLGALFAYLRYYRPSRLTMKNNCFIAAVIVVFNALIRWAVSSGDHSIYIVPTALAATYICAFIGHRVAIIAMANTILIAALLAPNPSEFIVLNMMTGMIAIFFAKNNHRRSALYWCVIAIFAVYSALHIALLLIHNGSIENLAAEDIFHFALNAGLVLAGYQLIFSLEKIFGYTSNATLIEIADTNQPLLRLLAEKAPATFQHSVQVAALAETAAVIIGANPLLARAGALYHDIGKMLNPSYFIENQVHGYNPHTHLAAEESAKIIIGHVSDGIAIAHKYRLPKTIVDFIPTHHGNSKTRYFYRIYKETHPAACDFSAFTYPGRNPHTREEAVVMLSDVVEASSRTLAQYSPKNIDQIVESAIDNVLADGVLKESPLTFADIYAIKSAFKKKLQNIYHARALE